MIETIEYKGKTYPSFQAQGNAAQFIMPFAKQFCKGVGYDIGCNRIEWMMTGSIAVDPDFMKDYITQRQQIRSGWDQYGFRKFFIPNSEEVIEWSPEYNATGLPYMKYGLVDFIFSSHCLEHIETPWYQVLEYWKENIRPGGVIFLYLPDYSQVYWRPWNNRKHFHIFTPEIMKNAFIALGMKNIFVSGVDLMNSFTIVGEVCHET